MTTDHDQDDSVSPLTESVLSDEPKIPSCPVCYEKRNDPPPPDLKERPSPLTTAGEVRALTRDSPRDGETHQAHVHGLLHWYTDLDSDVSCCFPDRRAHRNGYIVRTLCNRVLNIGRICGGKHIVGLGELMAYASKLDRYAKDLQLIEHEPTQLAIDVAHLSEELSRVSVFREHCEHKLPRLASRMCNGPADVRRMTQDGEKSFGRLDGMAIWGKIPAQHAAREFDVLREDIARSFEEEGELSKEAARSLARRLERIRDELNQAEPWLRECRRFFDNNNLTLALVASGLDTTVNVAKGQLVFTDEGKRRRLGLDGLFTA